MTTPRTEDATNRSSNLHPPEPGGSGPATERSRTKRRAFTLIELLAVMAIIALITTLALVGFTRTSRGRAFQAAVSDVHTALSLARQQAIAKGTPVIFLVCDEKFATRNSAKIGPEYITGQARTYAILDAKTRRFLKGWTELPQGVVFVSSPSAKEQDILDETSASPPTCLFTNIPYPSIEYTDWSALALGVAFLSDGSLFFRSSEINHKWRRLGLAEGTAPDGGSVTLIPNGQTNAILISLSGVASVEVP